MRNEGILGFVFLEEGYREEGKNWGVVGVSGSFFVFFCVFKLVVIVWGL